MVLKDYKKAHSYVLHRFEIKMLDFPLKPIFNWLCANKYSKNRKECSKSYVELLVPWTWKNDNFYQQTSPSNISTVYPSSHFLLHFHQNCSWGGPDQKRPRSFTKRNIKKQYFLWGKTLEKKWKYKTSVKTFISSWILDGNTLIIWKFEVFLSVLKNHEKFDKLSHKTQWKLFFKSGSFQ